MSPQGNHQDKSQDKNQASSSDNSSVQISQKLLEDLAKMLGQMPAPQPLEPKSIESYKFWKTQPVVAPGANIETPGVIEKKTTDDVPKAPQSLPDGFHWCTMDVTDRTQLKELYDLLYENYVEDDSEQFRFSYSIEFLEWALKPPGWLSDLTVGIRTTAGKLVASITGIPSTLNIRGEVIDMVEINFLCVHKRLRSKRMAPVLIKEVTRRCNLHGIWQALYTSGTMLPTPVSTCRYYHRTIDWPKLYDVGFCYLPENSTPEEQVKRYEVAQSASLKGFRPLRKEDIVATHALLTEYMKRFEVVHLFTVEELEHWLLSAPDIVKPFVVEDENGNITDFISFYGLESSVLSPDTKHSSINVAYCYYYATTAKSDQLKSRLVSLFDAAVVEAKKAKYDVLNALTLMDNPLFLEEVKFSKGDGLLHYYLFNYKTPRVNGGIDKNAEMAQPGGMAAIML